MSDSLKKKVSQGILWSFMERFSVQGTQFVLSLFIARILSPSDYGLIAMLGIFIGIAQTFIDSGFSSALIQKQDRTEVDFSTVFYFNIGVSFLAYCLFFLGAPFISAFYNQPLLESVIRILGLNLIINAFSAIQITKLTIDLNFKVQGYISFISTIIGGGCGVWMAYNGYGIWALVFQTLLINFIKTLVLWIWEKWVPLFVFSISSFQNLFSFGFKLLASSLLHVIYLNLYSLIIGKLFTSTELGYYNRANTIAQYPCLSMEALIVKVTFPFECRLQNNEAELQQKFFVFIRVTALVVFPLMFFLAALSKPLVQLILTDKWSDSVVYIQLMCLAYAVTPITRMNWDLLSVKRCGHFIIKSEIQKKVVVAVIMCITIPLGIKAICLGLIFNCLSDFIIISFYVNKIYPSISIKKELSYLFPIFIISFVSAMAGFCATHIPVSSLLQILIGGFISAFLFLSLVFLCLKESFKMIVFLIKNFR